jgi:acyl carrier protein phosphodiesterase
MQKIMRIFFELTPAKQLMNYLAHCVLSGKEEAVLFGNFIADSVRGKEALNYPPLVLRGIRLHHAIDTYTDAHPLVRHSKSLLWATQKHYAAVIVDLVYDHFLAAQFEQWFGCSLWHYTQEVYRIVDAFASYMPPRVQRFYPYMKKQNWLYEYRRREGLQRALEGIGRRSRHANRLAVAMRDIEQHYETLQDDFSSFFPDIQRFSRQWLAYQSTQ